MFAASANQVVPVLSSQTLLKTTDSLQNDIYILALISFNKALPGNRSPIAVDSAMYSASTVLSAISVCSLEAQVSEHPSTSIKGGRLVGSRIGVSMCFSLGTVSSPLSVVMS